MVLPRCSGIGAAGRYGSADNAINLVEMMGLNLEAAAERLPTRGFLADLALLMNHQKPFWSRPRVSVPQSIGKVQLPRGLQSDRLPRWMGPELMPISHYLGKTATLIKSTF